MILFRVNISRVCMDRLSAPMLLLFRQGLGFNCAKLMHMAVIVTAAGLVGLGCPTDRLSRSWPKNGPCDQVKTDLKG